MTGETELIWLSDGPTHATGFGRVTRRVVPLLAERLGDPWDFASVAKLKDHYDFRWIACLPTERITPRTPRPRL